MLINPEQKVRQRSDASQNDHKSKGYPSKTSEAAFTMRAAFEIDFQKSDFPALVPMYAVLSRKNSFGFHVGTRAGKSDF